MTDKVPSWDELQRRGGPEQAVTDFDRVCARLLMTADGKAFLAGLRSEHFDTPLPPASDERHLRVRAANQFFILRIEQSRDRGLKAPKK